MARRRSSSLTLTSFRASTTSIRHRAEEESQKISSGTGSCKKLILVITGGNGWLGSTIAKLAYERWDNLEEIRLFDSNPPDRSVISGITGFSTPAGRPKVSYQPGSVLDEGALLACFTKADAVIHCAAVVEKGSVLARRRMKSVNVDGTQRVIEACLECGVRALVFTGSLTQVIGTDMAKPIHYDESYQIKREELIYPHYGGSKNEAENLVLLANKQEGREGVPLRTCSLRCPLMYGEGDRNVVPIAIQAAKRCFGYYVPVGLMGNNAVTMQSLYVGNGAWAHILAAKKLLGLGDSSYAGEAKNGVVDCFTSTDIGGKFYYIGDHSPISSMTNFMAEFLRPLGYRVLPFGVPFWLVRVVVFFLEFLVILLAFLRIDVSSNMNRSTLRYMKASHSISWDRASKELEYAPLFSHKTALARSMEFYRNGL